MFQKEAQFLQAKYSWVASHSLEYGQTLKENRCSFFQGLEWPMYHQEHRYRVGILLGQQPTDCFKIN